MKDHFKEIVIIALLALGIVVVCVVGCRDFVCKVQWGLVPVYIASHDIAPRTKITDYDLLEISIPKAYLMDYAYTDNKIFLGNIQIYRGDSSGIAIYNRGKDEKITRCA